MVRVRRFFRPYVLLSAVGAVALVVTLSMFFLVRSWEHTRGEHAFRGMAGDRVHAIQEQIQDETYKLQVLKATFLSSVSAQAGRYGDFVREFRATFRSAYESDPAIDVAAFILRSTGPVSLVTPAGTERIAVTDENSSGVFVPAAHRPLYYPIVAAEPVARASRLEGWDPWNVPELHNAMQNALKTGLPVAASPSPTDSNETAEMSFWMFIPLLGSTEASAALAGARPKIEGFMAIRFLVGPLVEKAVGQLNPSGIDLHFYDYPQAGRRTLLYKHVSRTRDATHASQVVATSAPSEFTSDFTVQVGQRHWEVVAESAPLFEQSHRYNLSWVVLGGGILIIALLISFLLWSLSRNRKTELIVAERTAQLSKEVAEHKETEESLKQAHENLTHRVEIINRRSREIELLSEMGDLLLTCQTFPEALDVVAGFGRQLFPDEAGVVFMYNESRSFLDTAAGWGTHSFGDSVFPPDDCWGLRRGKMHEGGGPDKGLVCNHVKEAASGDFIYACLPLAAQGQTIGLLHLQRSLQSGQVGGARGSDGESQVFDPSDRRLIEAIGEHAAMGFANLMLRESLRQQSIRDPLTTLYNRRYMEESLEREIHRARRSSVTLSVIILDIDHFKKFNDTYGHEAGDVVLRSVADILRKSVRGEDIACRFGGEEFVLILPGASLEASRQKAESLRQEVERLTVVYGHDELPPVTISLGVSALDGNSGSGAGLLQSADEALYRAKKQGRNRVETAA